MKCVKLFYGIIGLFITSLYSAAWDALEDWNCTYLEEKYLKYIDKTEVAVVVELGAYLGLDAVLLHQYYNCPVYTFDCDQERAEDIKRNIKPYPAVKFFPYGAWNETKIMTFYHSNFPGSSSFFQHDVESKARKSNISVQELIDQQNLRMTPQTVQAVRLDDWLEKEQIRRIDLLCVDVQGAALKVFQGLGKRLADIKYIITEADFDDQYVGQCFYEEINDFLIANGFVGHFLPGDANPFYINTRKDLWKSSHSP
jgi:FkbM family methyltransferase